MVEACGEFVKKGKRGAGGRDGWGENGAESGVAWDRKEGTKGGGVHCGIRLGRIGGGRLPVLLFLSRGWDTVYRNAKPFRESWCFWGKW